MKQWLRGGANNTPHHASGTRATDRALSHTRPDRRRHSGSHDGHCHRHLIAPYLQCQGGHC